MTPWAVAHQAPQSIGFSRQECWSGLPCLPPGDLADPGIEPLSLLSPAFAGGFLTRAPPGKPKHKGLLLKARNHEEEGLLELRPDLETEKRREWVLSLSGASNSRWDLSLVDTLSVIRGGMAPPLEMDDHRALPRSEKSSPCSDIPFS